MDNPFGLTDREAQEMDLLIEHRGAKMAADKMGISQHAVNNLLRSAGRKIGERSIIGKVVAWDRARR